MTLRTLNYGNYGIFLIMGNAGFCPSTVGFCLNRYSKACIAAKHPTTEPPHRSICTGLAPQSAGMSALLRAAAWIGLYCRGRTSYQYCSFGFLDAVILTFSSKLDPTALL